MSEARHITLDLRPDELPSELGRGVHGKAPVHVDVAQSDPEPRFMRFRGIGAYRNTSVEEAVARVRALRDEWD
ncbi:hypothetical protein [Antarcticirhabdus aurantiaca]|uniref:Uncharacterized protein n=1 Tax=Antarcticirhabdus aurantiaca TaxID=2606717 RepID=A0ACD4NTE3_9HYPH|nr:hypothetical protein [Antarcticirhabdus aurantiaca]WAJ30141.1 hypothetical protein OXU80_08015 [Jeongeuplla avenae]